MDNFITSFSLFSSRKKLIKKCKSVVFVENNILSNTTEPTPELSSPPHPPSVICKMLLSYYKIIPHAAVAVPLNHLNMLRINNRRYKEKGKQCARYLSGFVCTYHPAAPGSSPKHAIYAFIIYSQICAIFVHVM